MAWFFLLTYTRHLSSCLFVGCTHSPRSHSLLCSQGLVPLPPRSILKSIGYIPVIFQVASLLAALTHPGHIVCYAPRDSFPCRRDASCIYPLSFKLPLCWLHSLTRSQRYPCSRGFAPLSSRCILKSIRYITSLSNSQIE